MTCLVHWRSVGPYVFQKRPWRTYCQNPGPFVNGLCSFHREFQHDGCGCQLAVDEARASIALDQLHSLQREG